MPEAEMFSGRISVEGSSMNPVRTRAAVNRVAVALERRLKENAPINKNPNKRGGTLRQSIRVQVGSGDLQTGIDISATAVDYIKYVIGGTGAHKIMPRNPGGALSFLWSTSARTSPVPGGGRLRISTRMPISGYASPIVNDLRRLVRTSDLRKGGDQVAFAYVNHPGSSANDFVPEAIAAIGPELATMEEAIGEDLADQVMQSLQSVFGTQSVRM